MVRSDDRLAAIVPSGRPLHDDRLRFTPQTRRIAAGLELKPRNTTLLFRTVGQFHIRVTEYDNEPILFVFRMKGKRGDASAHVEKEIFLARRVVRNKAINPAFVLRHKESLRERILCDENRSLE